MANPFDMLFDEINFFVTSINNLPSLDKDLFDAILVKKLSNSNVTAAKKYCNAAKGKKSNQTHIDFSNKPTAVEFFYGSKKTPLTPDEINLEIFSANNDYLSLIDKPVTIATTNNRKKPIIRTIRDQNALALSYNANDTTCVDIVAYKKPTGHNGTQTQLNFGKKASFIKEWHSHIYEHDYLVLLRYNYNDYCCIGIPHECGSKIQSIINREKLDQSNTFVFNKTLSKTTSKTAYKKHLKQRASDETKSLTNLTKVLSKGQDVDTFVKVRYGQGIFRKLLIEHIGCKCQLCDITIAAALRASHIKSWKSSSPSEKVDPENGLLLCANHDALFDRHLISFDPATSLIAISETIPKSDYKSLKISATMKLPLSTATLAYMKRHYEIFVEQES